MPPTPDVTVVIPTRGRPALVTRRYAARWPRPCATSRSSSWSTGRTRRPSRRSPRSATPGCGWSSGRPRGAPPTPATPAYGRPAAVDGAARRRRRVAARTSSPSSWTSPRTRRYPLPIVISRLINRTPRAEFVMPRRLPEPGEPLSEYFTLRRGLFHGDGFIQTSTIMAPTELLRRVPFTVGPAPASRSSTGRCGRSPTRYRAGHRRRAAGHLAHRRGPAADQQRHHALAGAAVLAAKDAGRWSPPGRTRR